MIYLVRGDIGSQIKATLTRDDDGTAVDLTGAAVRLRVRAYNSATTLFTVTAETGSPSQLLAGIVIFTFSESNLDQTPGRYEGEIEATFPDANIETVYEFVEFMLRDDFEQV